MPADHYQTLGLRPDADAEAIRRAYREAAKRLHPDVNAQADAAAQFARVQKAYAALSDPDKRRAYDARRAARAGRVPPCAPGAPGASGASGEPAGPQGHYAWANVAARPSPPRASGPRRGRAADHPPEPARPSRSTDPTGFDELWEALFEPRLRARGERSA